MASFLERGLRPRRGDERGEALDEMTDDVGEEQAEGMQDGQPRGASSTSTNFDWLASQLQANILEAGARALYGGGKPSTLMSLYSLYRTTSLPILQ